MLETDKNPNVVHNAPGQNPPLAAWLNVSYDHVSQYKLNALSNCIIRLSFS